MVRVNKHGDDVHCNTFYEGDICIDTPSGGGCTAMSRGKAVDLALEILELASEMGDNE